jgi:hypothetical protein
MADAATSAPGPRHLNLENLDKYWSAGVPVEVPIGGEPECRLRLDPRRDEMCLLTPLAGAEPDVSRLRNIELNTFVVDDESWGEVRINIAGSPHGAYIILSSIADRIQVKGESLAVAVPRAIAEHRGLLAGRVGLSEEQEIGLYGELLLLEAFLWSADKRRALSAWAGPLSEEHDFVLDDIHVEVKTTSAERRRHLIGTLQQLKPVREVPLWLLSIQITRSSGAGGRTLAQLVQDVRAQAGEAVIDLDDRLAAAGWDDDACDLFTTVWALRSTPRCYRVDDAFPALTHDRLAEVVPRVTHVSDVSYRVDVTDLDDADAPAALAAFVTTEDRK